MDRLEVARRGQRRTGRVGPGQDHRELVAAPAVEAVALAPLAPQGVGDFDQSLVAHLVAEGVVNLLEPV